jgi:hypothetical protein
LLSIRVAGQIFRGLGKAEKTSSALSFAGNIAEA